MAIFLWQAGSDFPAPQRSSSTRRSPRLGAFGAQALRASKVNSSAASAS